MYSELSYLWEAWLKVRTNNSDEAIIDTVQNKSLVDYQNLMTASFTQCFNILKPGHWMTVEFHNSKNSVWNAIQQSLSRAGFIIADVRTLDKKQGSFKQVNNTSAVKQDLVISAYKPKEKFRKEFESKAGTDETAWTFVRQHLANLPVVVDSDHDGKIDIIAERQAYLLFDRMVAYHIMNGIPVPIDATDFYKGLDEKFLKRDGMYFLPDQMAEYDRKKMTSGELKQMSMFVSDEASAIQWLRQLIKEKPQTFSDINPQFMQQLGGWSKNEAQLDLRELLNQNFLCYDGKGPVPEQIHAYLSTNWKELRNLPKDDPALVTKARDRWYVPDPNKAGDLEKLREKALLKEFEEYKEVKKKLKVFRLEAVRAGFKKAWQERDYAVIVAVADKIPNNVLEEDPKLLMWYDQAVTRMGGE